MRIARIIFMHMLFYLVITGIFTGGLLSGEIDKSRFFRMGDGKVLIHNVHNESRANVFLFNPDGTFDRKALVAIDEVFGFPSEDNDEHVSLRLIFMLDYFSDISAPGEVIHLVSGYRSPLYNEKLKKSGGNVARTSAHIDGMAVDFYIEGVEGKKLWELIRRENCCGVGHYGGKYIHLDSGRPRFWEAATSKVDTKVSERNRRIWLSTDYDRYRKGEKVRLQLSSVSDLGFGIARKIAIKNGDGVEAGLISVSAKAGNEDGCILVNERDMLRSVYFQLPEDIKPGRYIIRMDFCRRPFKEMPATISSNEIEIIAE